MTDDTTSDTPTTLDPRTARDSLDAATAHQRATRDSGLWFARYMAVFGAGFGVLTLLLGLGPDGSDAYLWWLLGVMGLWAVLLVVMVLWAWRRPVMVTPPRRIAVPGWVGTGVLYGAALFLSIGQAYPVWAWLLAAVVVAAPLLLAAGALRHDVHRADVAGR